MRIITISLYILLISQIVFAQQISVESLREKYTNFEYEQVVELADQMLKDDAYSRNELVQILEMKGVAHYSLGEEQDARFAFNRLLEQDADYYMNTQQISPKIVSFFNDVKEEFQKHLEEERPILDSLNTLRKQYLLVSSNYKAAVVKNFILPGWGHFQLKHKTKGIIYGVLGVSSITSTIYFIMKTNSKRSDYLNETNVDLIPGKYNEYNDAYKMRNISISALAAVWLASQIDILFLSDDQDVSHISYSSPLQNHSEVSLSFSIPLH